MGAEGELMAHEIGKLGWRLVRGGSYVCCVPSGSFFVPRPMRVVTTRGKTHWAWDLRVRYARLPRLKWQCYRMHCQMHVADLGAFFLSLIFSYSYTPPRSFFFSLSSTPPTSTRKGLSAASEVDKRQLESFKCVISLTVMKITVIYP